MVGLCFIFNFTQLVIRDKLIMEFSGHLNGITRRHAQKSISTDCLGRHSEKSTCANNNNNERSNLTMAPIPPHFTIDHKSEDQIVGVDHFPRNIATHAAKIKLAPSYRRRRLKSNQPQKTTIRKRLGQGEMIKRHRIHFTIDTWQVVTVYQDTKVCPFHRMSMSKER